jgi:protein-S-isoprenylcysteine O-methyltransferase Ste14
VLIGGVRILVSARTDFQEDPRMNPLFGTLLFFAATIASIVIRAPHAHKSKVTPVARSARGRLDAALLVLMGVAVLLLPLLYATTNVLAFADHPLPAWAFALGVVVVVLWLWSFHRSHKDLGTNWSVTLEVREQHRLVTHGVYSRIRHPMYTSLFLNALAQLLLLANWVAGAAMLVVFTAMFVTRLGPEERLMRETFGAAYDDYAARTKRLVPGVW